MFIEERMVRAKGARRGRQPWLRQTGGARSEPVSERLLDNRSQERSMPRSNGPVFLKLPGLLKVKLNKER